MIQKRWPAFALVASVVVLLACCWITFLLADPNGWWLFVAQPPVPPHATHVEVFYPSNDVERGLNFETEQSLAIIQHFYRGELPKHGWLYRCTVLPLPMGMETEDVDRAGGNTVQPTASPTQAPSEVAPPVDVNTLRDVYERRGARWIGREQTLEILIEEYGASAGIGVKTMVRLREYKVRFVGQLDPCPAR